jgi:hypothetical protein
MTPGGGYSRPSAKAGGRFVFYSHGSGTVSCGLDALATATAVLIQGNCPKLNPDASHFANVPLDCF